MRLSSQSQLARYASGHTLPPLEYAAHLDQLYDARGWAAMALRTLWRSRWDPWSADESRLALEHAGSWPAMFSGSVWIKLWPSAQEVDREFRIVLNWGRWRRVVTTRVPHGGVVLVTGKSVDEKGMSVTLNLHADRPIFSLFGAGDVFDDFVVHIEHGWTDVEATN